MKDSSRPAEDPQQIASQMILGRSKGFPTSLGARPHVDSRTGGDGRPLVTYRNNFDTASQAQIWRVPRPYVQRCAQATLGLFLEGGRVVFKPLMCGSWSCPQCRKALAAKMLDRLRRGLESRDSQLALLTLTVNPAKFGARIVGKALQDDGRETNLWSEPTQKQFKTCTAYMSREFKKLMDRLNRKATRMDLDRYSYFRVIELHRSGWPHYHVVLEHSQLDLEEVSKQLGQWSLGRTDARPVSVDDAVGEVAPYLVCSERKAGGHKAYQFAATALPKHFRLHSASKAFLGAPQASERVPAEHSQVLRGHWTGFRNMLESFGATDTAWVCPSPAEHYHRPPSALQGSGDGAVVLFAELVHQEAMHAPPQWFRKLEHAMREAAAPKSRAGQQKRRLLPGSSVSAPRLL